MNNVHPIFKVALSPFAPKSADQLLADQLKPFEVDISIGHRAEPIYVTPDLDTVKEAAAEVLENHARELTDVIVRKLQRREREYTP